jgi:hypothetical protein
MLRIDVAGRSRAVAMPSTPRLGSRGFRRYRLIRAALSGQVTMSGRIARRAPSAVSRPRRAGARRNPAPLARRLAAERDRPNVPWLPWEWPPPHNRFIMRRWAFPAHTRMASSPERAARALATLSEPPATLRAVTEGASATLADSRRAGLSLEVVRTRPTNDAPPSKRNTDRAATRRRAGDVPPTRRVSIV